MANTDYGALPLSIAENMGSILNEKHGVTTGFKPTQWVDAIRPLIKPADHEAGGAVASFIVPNPIQSIETTIVATQDGTGTPSPSNVRSINGWDGCKVNVAGTNLLNGKDAKDFAIDSFSTSTSGENETGKFYTLLASYPIHYVNVFPWLRFKENTQYTFIVKIAKDATSQSTNLRFAYSDGTYSNINRTNTSSDVTEAETLAVTSRANKTLIGITGFFASNRTYIYYEHMGIFEGVKTVNDYEPYIGHITDIPFGQTVYGGRLNIKTGELVITHGIVDMGSLSWIYNTSAMRFWAVIPNMKRPCNLLCESYVQSEATRMEEMADFEIWNRGYAYNDKNIIVTDSNYTSSSDFKTAATGVHLVYELAESITVALDPADIKAIAGANNIWTDCGEVAVVYRSYGA